MEAATCAINVFQCNTPRTLIALRQFQEVHRLGEFWFLAKQIGECDNEEAFPDLWHTVVGRIQDGISGAIPREFEGLADFFGYVVPAEIQNVLLSSSDPRSTVTLAYLSCRSLACGKAIVSCGESRTWLS